MYHPGSDHPALDSEGRALTIRCRRGDLHPFLLIPGDPARVGLITSFWESAAEVAQHRHYRSASGTYRGVPISALSTGIGGPAAEIALVEAATLGVETVIRVGTTGSLLKEARCGDLMIAQAAVKFDSTCNAYVPPEYPAFAHHEVVQALIQACEELGFSYHLGIAATTGSFYAGQGRAAAGGFRPSRTEDFLDDLAQAGVTHLEMEGATIFTLSAVMRLRAGMIAAVVADRVRGEWADAGGERRACEAACRAVAILSQWDAVKRSQGRTHFHPGLLERSHG